LIIERQIGKRVEGRRQAPLKP